MSQTYYARPEDLHGKQCGCEKNCIAVVDARDFNRAINGLKDIASLGKKQGSEIAKHTLATLGIDTPDYGSMT